MLLVARRGIASRGPDATSGCSTTSASSRTCWGLPRRRPVDTEVAVALGGLALIVVSTLVSLIGIHVAVEPKPLAVRKLHPAVSDPSRLSAASRMASLSSS